MLRADSLYYRIGQKTLLNNASLEIVPGEVTVILGPNGAGKSTFMKLLCGDLRPSSGTVSLDGTPTERLNRQTVAQRRAMMPQSSNVVFPFSAIEIVMIGRSPHVVKAEGNVDRQIAELAMRCTGTSALSERSYNTLSGGEKQRVQLARALAQIWVEPNAINSEARYLLLDEPVAAMDISHQHETLRIAKQFAQRNVGVLLILHDINLAAMYADKIAMFSHGQIVRHGTPSDVLSQTLISQVFGIDVLLSEHPTLGCPLMVSLLEPFRHTNTHPILNKVGGLP